MQFDVVSIITGAVVIGNFGLAMYVLSRSKKDTGALATFLFLTLLSIWALIRYIYRLPIPFAIQHDLFLLDFLISPVVAWSYVVFSAYFPVKQPNVPTKTLGALLILAVFSAFVAGSTQLVIEEIISTPVGISYIQGPLDIVYAFFVIALLILGGWNLFHRYQMTTEVAEKEKIRLMIVATISTAILVTVSVLLLERFLNGPLSESWLIVRALPDVATVSTLLIPVSIAFSLVKYRVYGVQILFGKFVFWFGIAGFLFTVFYTVSLLELWWFESVLDPNVILLNLLLAVVVAISFTAYERHLRWFVDKRFLRFAYDYEDILDQFSMRIEVLESREEVKQLFLKHMRSLFSVENQGLLIAFSKDQEVVVNEKWEGYSQIDVQRIESSNVVNLLLDGQIPEGNILVGLDIKRAVMHSEQNMNILYVLGKSHKELKSQDIKTIQQLLHIMARELKGERDE